MDTGALRHRVSIQVPTETSDGHDGIVETWTTRHARWPAQVLPLLGRDLQSARQIDPRISHQVSLRYWRDYSRDLKGGRSRFIYHPTSNAADDRTFEPVTPPIDVEERHIALQVSCRELA